MGRKSREKYHLTLHQQAHQKLVSMQAFGESRAEDKLTGADRQRIYSFSTYKTYRRAVMRFIKYVEHHHPECTTLKKAKKYANEWLQTRVDAGMSAWTISMETSALCKLYNILPDAPKRFHAPKRRREDIKRSRGDAKWDRHFSVKNNDELIRFVCGTGTRRNVLERLKGDDLWSRERMEMQMRKLSQKEKLTDEESLQLSLLQNAIRDFPKFGFFIFHARDKGGKNHYAPVWPEQQELVVRRMQEAGPNGLVFQHVHDAADIHHYRGIYCQNMYKMLARTIEEIPFIKSTKAPANVINPMSISVAVTKKGVNWIEPPC